MERGVRRRIRWHVKAEDERRKVKGERWKGVEEGEAKI